MLKASARNSVVSLLFLAMVFIGALSGVNSGSPQVSSPKLIQTSQNSKAGKIEVRLFDSITGYGIYPKALDEVTMKSNLQEYKAQKSDENNTLFLQASQGGYDLRVTIEGYQPATTKVSVDEESTPIEVLLDPIQTPPEMKAEYVNSLTKPDMATVIGYIVDDRTGQPLAKATVSLSDRTIKVRSNKRGFYVLQIPVQDNNIEDKPILKNILFDLPGYTIEERQYVQAFPNQATVYRIRLTPSEGRNVIDERQYRNNAAAEWDEQPQTGSSPPSRDSKGVDSLNGDATKVQQGESISTFQPNTVTVPTMIRVGTNCILKNCTGQVLVMSLDAYCKRSLPAEWPPQWDMNSLKAGAVAVRSYAAWFVNHPISPRYDICGTTACQSFGNVTNPQTDSAVNQTTNIVLIEGNNIVQSEYSRENNNSGCGDCFTGTAGTVCISDNVCCGDNDPKSHGRGMCQRGSQRWATGTKFSPSGPVPSGNAPKDWVWILNHYYPRYKITGIASDFSISTSPSVQPITRGSSASYTVTIQSQNGFSGGVRLSALNLPPGYTGAFWSPSDSITVPPNGTATSTLFIYTSSNTSVGTFTITIKAVSGSLTKQNFVQLIINSSLDFWDQQAQQDMRNRASHDARFLSARPETFGKDLNWSSEFELRWMAFNVTRNRSAFVYQARSKSTGNRFTTYFDPDTGQQVPWQLAN